MTFFRLNAIYCALCHYCFGIALIFSCATVHAVDIKYALGKLVNNPVLLSAKEQYSQALLAKSYAISTALPSVSIELTKESITEANGPDRKPDLMHLRIAQPIFSFGSTILSYKQADDQILAAYNKLLAIEQDVILDLLKAYLNVIKSRKILDITIKNKNNLSQFLEQTRARFHKGEVTKTDVSLARSRLESAISDLTDAENKIRNAEAEYAQITGETPNYALVAPEDVADMPTSLEEILRVALRSNRSLLQAMYNYKTKQEAVRIAITKALPSVDLSAAYARSPLLLPMDLTDGGIISSTDSGSLAINVHIPLFRGGGYDYIQIQSAKYTSQAAFYDYQSVMRTVDKNAVEAWSYLQTSKAKIVSNHEAVESAKTALDGTMHESKAGFRTSFDVLIAEQQVMQTAISLEESKFGYMTAMYSVLHIMGNLTIVELLRRI